MDIFITVVVGVGMYIVLPLLILWGRDKLFYPPPSKEELEAAHKRFEARLRNPDLAAVEAHFGTSLPTALRELYSNLDEVMRADFEVVPPNGEDPVYICYYNPADAENLSSPWPGCEKYFAFAGDGGGNGLLVNPTLDDPPVLLHCHELGDLETVASSMTEFMKWQRRPAD